MLIKGTCNKCSRAIEFDAEDIGKTLPCPECGKPTPLWNPGSQFTRASRKPQISKRQIILGLVGLVLMILILSAVSKIAGVPVLFSVICACLSAVGLFIYLLPSFMAHGKRNATAIRLLNIFLGWTFLGWIVALVWAATKDGEARSK